MSASEVRELRVQSGTSTLPSSKQNTTPSQVRRSFDVSPDVSPDTEIKNLSFRKLVRGFFGN